MLPRSCFTRRFRLAGLIRLRQIRRPLPAPLVEQARRYSRYCAVYLDFLTPGHTEHRPLSSADAFRLPITGSSVQKMGYRCRCGHGGSGLPSSADIYGGYGGLFSRMARGGKHHIFAVCNGGGRRYGRGPPATYDLHTGDVIHGRGGEGGEGADGKRHDGPGSVDLHPARVHPSSSIGGGDGNQGQKPAFCWG